MKCQDLFSLKNKKWKILKCHLLQILLGTLRVKHRACWIKIFVKKKKKKKKKLHFFFRLILFQKIAFDILYQTLLLGENRKGLSFVVSEFDKRVQV